MSCSCLSTMAVAWGAGEQAALEYGGNTLRQLTLKPAALLQEYWPWAAGGVVVILLLRWYLRK